MVYAAEMMAAQSDAATSATTPSYMVGLMMVHAQLEAMLARSSTARIERLLDAVIDGEIDGASYHGNCRCPVGWLDPNECWSPLDPDTLLVEGFAFAIQPEQTPETNGRLRRLERWIAAYLGRRYEAEEGQGQP